MKFLALCSAIHAVLFPPRMPAKHTKLVTVIVAAMLFVGCGGTQHPRSWDQNAHIGINTSAHALVLLDRTLSAAAAHDTATGTPDAVLVTRYQLAARAEQQALADLVLLEHGVDLAVATGAQPDRCRLAFLAQHAGQSIADLRAALSPLNVTLPADVSSAVPLLAAIVSDSANACPSGSPSP